VLVPADVQQLVAVKVLAGRRLEGVFLDGSNAHVRLLFLVLREAGVPVPAVGQVFLVAMPRQASKFFWSSEPSSPGCRGRS
jgi:hypothetical protein